MAYHRISFEEREEIGLFRCFGCSTREIGSALSRNASSISREVRRFDWDQRGYRSLLSQRDSQTKASSRRHGKRRITQNKKLRSVILRKLRLFWSPDQIAEYLKTQYDDQQMQVSAESIYTYLYVLPRGELRTELTRCLRRQHKKRRTRGRSAKGQRSVLDDMLSIEERPKAVAKRTVPGHWEGDMIIGGRTEQSSLGTLVERTTRSVILVPLKNKTAREVRMAFAREIKKLPKQMRLTLTYDQGREMAQHKLFTKETKMKVYFAHPRSPWERGTNENTNGLIRQFFPKGTNFRRVSRTEIKRVQHLLNGRPRKTLGYSTPYEAMEALLR